MYRPTVRYSDIYREYVMDVLKATNLDGNQIIRLALFYAAHSDGYLDILKQYESGNAPLPKAPWEINEHNFWLQQHYEKNQENLAEIKSPPCKKEDITEGSQSNDVQVIKLCNQGEIRFTLT